MTIFVTGSLAYDVIKFFPGNFGDHILPDQTHNLNVSFPIERVERDFGGTAGNIAYNMTLLGARPVVVSMIGTDGQPYLDRFQAMGIDTRHIHRSADKFTSIADIMTDKKNNQITGFYPGAGLEAKDIDVCLLIGRGDLLILSPAEPQSMLKHAAEAKLAGARVVFDPGQQITSFSAGDVRKLLELSDYFIANDYEFKLIEEMTGLDEDSLLRIVSRTIKTLGGEGCLIRTDYGYRQHVPAAPVKEVLDPTGAGDAFRAGFFVTREGCGHTDYLACARVGSVAAAYVVEQRGTQNHFYTREEFRTRLEAAYR